MSSSGANGPSNLTTLVSGTAGKTISLWDTVLNRWQLAYGDTGLLQIVAPGGIPTMPNLAVYLRRFNYDITVITTEITGGGTAAGATSLFSMPAGFRPTIGGSAPSISANVVFDQSVSTIAGASLYISDINPYNLTIKAVAGARHYATLQYVTVDAWPTTLPGVAVGPIPNT